MFSDCSKLTTTYTDVSWVLPTSGISGSRCFYLCFKSLVGSYGTFWASSEITYTYFHIGTTITPGYLTVT